MCNSCVFLLARPFFSLSFSTLSRLSPFIFHSHLFRTFDTSDIQQTREKSNRNCFQKRKLLPSARIIFANRKFVSSLYFVFDERVSPFHPIELLRNFDTTEPFNDSIVQPNTIIICGIRFLQRTVGEGGPSKG